MAAGSHPGEPGCHRTVVGADGGTRAGRTPTGSGRCSWMPSCRSAPVSPGTWTTRPRCVPPPTGGPERSSLPIGPASPPHAGCADSTGRQQRSRGRWDCHTLCPSTGSGCLPGAPLRCSPGSASRVSYHGRWLRPPPRSGVRPPRRPGCSSCSQLCPGRWGFVQWRPPQTGLAHGAVRRLPFPATPPSSSQPSTRTAQMPSSPSSTQRWKVRWIVLSSPRGQTVPLAAAAHPEDDAVQHPPGVGAFAPRTI